MSESEKFKYISIDDDDEVVIQTGVFQEAESCADPEEASSRQEISSSEEGAEAFDFDEAGNKGHAQEDAELARHERERARRAAQAQANRMITTEEDLKIKAPFSNMRRGIIIAAILILVVAWLYFNFH